MFRRILYISTSKGDEDDVLLEPYVEGERACLRILGGMRNEYSYMYTRVTTDMGAGILFTIFSGRCSEGCQCRPFSALFEQLSVYYGILIFFCRALEIIPTLDTLFYGTNDINKVAWSC